MVKYLISAGFLMFMVGCSSPSLNPSYMKKIQDKYGDSCVVVSDPNDNSVYFVQLASGKVIRIDFWTSDVNPDENSYEFFKAVK